MICGPESFMIYAAHEVSFGCSKQEDRDGQGM